MNEKGFMYPMTLCFFLLTSLLLTIEISQYISQKKFVSEIISQERRQYFFLLSSKKVSKQISEGVIPAEGIFIYDDTNVSYKVSLTSDGQYEVAFSLKQSTLQLECLARYEKVSGKLIKWLVPI